MISLFLTNILSRALGLLAAIFMSILVVNFANATERLFPDSAQLQSGNSAPAASSSRSPLDDLLAESRRLHANNEAKAAYELLVLKTDTYAGVPEFDYQLGITATDAGLPGRAILALERVLLVSPNNLQARAEIARAYLAAGETEAARRQFELVAAQQIPAEVRKVIDIYLAGIARAETESGTQRFAYAEIGLGYDSNVNFGSQSSQWQLADGTAVTPSAISQPRSSMLSSVTVGASLAKPMSGNFSLIFGSTLSYRSTPSAHTLDQVQIDLNMAARYKRGCHESVMQTQLQSLRLDDSVFRNAVGLTGQWRCDLNPKTQIGAYLQGFDFSFPSQNVRDARRTTTGLTLTRLLDHPRQPILVGSIYLGQERTRNEVRQLDHDFHGLRVSMNARIGDGWRGFSTVSWEARSFQGVESLFGVTREDRQTELRLGAEKDLSRQWTLAPQFTITRNSSTLAPNEFRRSQATLFARYRF